jgi:glyoxalase family protein
VADHDTLLEMRESLLARGLDATEVKDRHFFHSVYFHEPGGVLFELATDGPGFVDTYRGRSGDALTLPPWLESRRDTIESGLPPIRA